jgi:hypothetical protein
MENGYLRLRFQDDRDGTGKLLARAKAAGFAGEGSAWFGISELEEFTAAALAFPLLTDQPVLLRGGFWKEGQLEQEHLAIEIYPIDRRGHIAVQVRVSSELWASSHKQSQFAARIEIITSYQALSNFMGALRALVNGREEEVLLEGEAIGGSYLGWL